MDNPHIECRSLYKIYKNRKHSFTALSDINLRISKGEFVVINGKSGAGKSTLLSLMGGLIRPTSGQVLVDGMVINELNNMEMSKILVSGIGVIFQGFNLLPSYNIYENIEVALLPFGYGRTQMKNLIMPFLDRFNLADKIGLMPEQLSAGQQQKVAIIRTLVKQPGIILADEPTGSVDSETAAEIASILGSECTERKVTVVIATHGNFPLTRQSRIVMLKNGSIVTPGSRYSADKITD